MRATAVGFEARAPGDLAVADTIAIGTDAAFVDGALEADLLGAGASSQRV